jgi:phospholipid/cholesterol/gamma-HCH transport system substrate-binding protein
MIRRGVKLQLIAFALITVLGISYTAVNIVGLGDSVLNRRYTVGVDLADSGGIFTNAEVTYRGVPIGRVGELTLTRDGVRAELRLERGHPIPRDTLAVVGMRSAVGEQYIDLLPRQDSVICDRDAARCLRDGDVIPKANTRLPVSTAELLGNLDRLLGSVDSKDLVTVLTELDKAFSGMGPELQSIIDSNGKILDTAHEVYPEFVSLLRNGNKVLDTQRRQSSSILEFSRNLADLSEELRKADPDIRAGIDAAGPALTETDDLVGELSPTLPVLLANGTTVGQVLAARLPGLRQLLISYPLALAGTGTPLPGDGTIHFGMALNLNAPPVCTKGYGGTKIRYPHNTKKIPANQKAYCKEPKDSPIAVRGARNAPPPGPGPVLPPGSTDGAGEPPAGTSGPGPYGGTSAAGAATPGSSGASAASGAPEAASGASRPSGAASGPPGAATAGGVPGTSAPGGSDVWVTAYDPTAPRVVGPDGKIYTLGDNGSAMPRVLGENSWQWLLLGPLTD